MKANKFNIKNNTKAQVGIGTLIIFIAMVLVAAVAAAVLIQTSGVLQQQALSTGKEATQEVSSNIVIRNIDGVRAADDNVNMSSTLDLLRLNIALNSGSGPVDINQVVISITDGTNTNNLVYAGNTRSHETAAGQDDGSMTAFSSTDASANLEELLTGNTSSVNNAQRYFSADRIRDDDASFSQSNPVMNSGDLIRLYISSAATGSAGYAGIASTDTSAGIADSGLTLLPRTTVNIVMTPEAGTPTAISFVTPPSYGTREIVQLYP
ncbi:MAG: flagellin [Methanolobus sp.]|nr:flagellin [Methanolobus sp.]